MKPHDPFIAPKKYFDLYPPELAEALDAIPPTSTPCARTAVGFGEYGEAFAKFTDQEWRELFRAYCAGTSFMDAQLGRVLDALDKHQLWDKTLVIFVGDHGYHTGERQWWNKNTLFERSCRAPLIIAAPGMKGGQTTPLAGRVRRSLSHRRRLLRPENAPRRPPGASLRPVLADPAASIKDAAFTLVTRGPKLHGQSIRTARWRFTRWSDGQTELYDHDTDPEELHNVAGQHPGIVKELAGQIRSLPRLQP